MNFEIEHVRSIPDPKPVYFSDKYLQIFSEIEHSQSLIFKISFSQGNVYLPMNLRSVGDVFEGSSVYGYGGFWCPKDQVEMAHLVRHHWLFLTQRLFEQYGIMNFFLRSSPFLQNDVFLPPEHSQYNRMTYVRPLSLLPSLEVFLHGIDSNLRWSCRYAARHGFIANLYSCLDVNEEELFAFWSIYDRLMRSKDTPSFYLFSYEFFKKHFDAMPEQTYLMVVKNAEGVVVAGSLFLVDGLGWVHYHLSAADLAYQKFQVMELLLLTAIFEFGQKGYAFLHLGGGLTPDGSDGLSKFKHKFGPRTLSFYISKIVCDEIHYNKAREACGVCDSHLFLITDAIEAAKC